MDRFIGFLISPIVQGILIMIIIGGIYFELQTPGVGFPLVAAITACLLYFAPLYLEGMANYVEMILFVVGIILLLLEIFVIPGFGVTGVLGIVCVVASLVLAGIDDFTFDFLPDFTSAIIRSLFREYLVEPKIVWFPTIEFCSSRRTESGGWFRGCGYGGKGGDR